METVPVNDMIQLHSDTVDFLRKQYDLDTKRINESINHLEEWLKKQHHFVDKKLDREYLERALILAKGSVEKVKKKLDSLYTYRTLLPKFFQLFDADICRNSKAIIDGILPKLTSDHYRVYYLRVVGNKIDDMLNYYRWCRANFEYFHKYDYCNGVIGIFDYTECEPLGIIKSLDLIDVHNIIQIMIKGFGVKLKAFHVISQSKAINIVLHFFRQAMSGKIADRLVSHKNFDTLLEALPREILPSECGGNERSIYDLHLDWVNALSSPKFSAYLEKTKSNCTDENLRPKDKFNNECMGMPGSFRTLCLD